jgi:hypothetical protein
MIPLKIFVTGYGQENGRTWAEVGGSSRLGQVGSVVKDGKVDAE